MDYSSASNEVLIAELEKLSGGNKTITSGKKKEFIYIVKQLDDAETPLAAFRGDLDGTKGRFVLLTDKSLYLVSSGIFKGLSFEKFSHEDIISSDSKEGRLSSALNINLKGTQLKFTGLDKASAINLSKNISLSSIPEIIDTIKTSGNNTKSDTDLLVEKLERIDELKHFEVINSKEFTLIKEYILSTVAGSNSTIDILKLCDDIDKLSDLVDSGILTKKEFVQQKEKLLGQLQTPE